MIDFLEICRQAISGPLMKEKQFEREKFEREKVEREKFY